METDRWKQIDAILCQALEAKDQRDREQVVAAACGEDIELRAEVDQLLAFATSGPLFVEGSAGFSDQDFPLGKGDQVGSWTLDSVLGEGGSGLVFSATRTDAVLEPPVAIKCLRSSFFSRHARERFRSECRILARLNHPNIARLWDAGTTEIGIPYLVIEQVDGEQIDQWCQSDQPTLDQRLELFGKVCSSVAVAHQQAIVHRDLKPSNILVTSDVEPKLLDFGIARVLNTEWTRSSRITLTGSQPMTPQYASPEQLRGEELTIASDVYSLGLVLFKLLTGVLPYQLDAKEVGESLPKLPEGRSLRPSSARASDVPADQLRGDLDRMTQKALSFDPSLRYESAAELADEIQRFRDGLPIVARAPSTLYTARRFFARNRTALLHGALVTATFVASSMKSAVRRKRRTVRASRPAVSSANSSLSKAWFSRSRRGSAFGEPRLYHPPPPAL